MSFRTANKTVVITNYEHTRPIQDRCLHSKSIFKDSFFTEVLDSKAMLGDHVTSNRLSEFCAKGTAINVIKYGS